MEIKSRYKRSLLKRVSKIIFSIDSKVKRWTKKKKKGRQGRRKKADRPIRRRAHEARLQNTAASAIDSASRIFRWEKRRHDHNPRKRHYARKPHRARTRRPAVGRSLVQQITPCNARNQRWAIPSNHANNVWKPPRKYVEGKGLTWNTVDLRPSRD